jgi:hypothetical protein
MIKFRVATVGNCVFLVASCGLWPESRFTLSEGRKAWLVIPTPFYEADKLRLKAQIDLLLTEDLE